MSAAGVTPSMRPAWPRLAGRTAASFCRTSVESPAIAAIVEVGRQLERLVAPHRLDVRLLPLQVDGILRVDRDLLGDRCRNRAELRPDRREPREVDAGKGEQLEGACGGCRPG